MDFDILLNERDELFSRALFDGFVSGWNHFTTMMFEGCGRSYLGSLSNYQSSRVATLCDLPHVTTIFVCEKSVELKGIVSLVMALVTFVTSEDAPQVFAAIGQGIQKEIVAVKQPIDETIAAVGSSQCANVKKILGVSYEQIEGEHEPDLNKLNLVYKTRSETKEYNLKSASGTLRRARGFDFHRKLIIFVHGFTDNPYKSSFQNFSDSVLESGVASDVIALDGSSLIRWLYLRSTTYVQFMGYALAETLAALVEDGLDASSIHMVGHSLGAHICGFAGKRFQERTGKKLGRISGLDPAGPCFSYVNSTHRLNDTDAEYVDVIHSDAGVYGIRSPVGQADYYPNDGKMQPECWFQTCSHSRSHVYYGESVLFPENFPAVRCDDWEAFKNGKCDEEISYMGYASKPGTKGLFFLQTGGKYPYGLGLEGIKYKNNKGLVGTLHEDVSKNSRILSKLPIIG